MGSGQSIPGTLGACLQSNIPSNLVALPTKWDWRLTDVVPYNTNIEVNPAAVVYPNSTAHVQAAVKCAKQFNATVQAKTGGHSYGNYAYGGGDDNVVVVDLRNMKSLSWDSNWTAHVTGAWTLGDLTNDMLAAGNRAFAHGVCPQVGLGGHATMGGLGPPSRMWGTALDHVLGITVVLADGSVQKASASQNSDLFWAFKGAGGSFGIVTEMDIMTRPAINNITRYSFTFSGRPFAQHAQRAKDWQNLVSQPGLSRKFASQMVFTPVGLVISGTYFGPPSEFAAMNLTSVFPDSTNLQVVAINGWGAALTEWAQDEGLLIGGGIPNAFYAKSLVFTPQTLIPDSGIDALVQYLDATDPGTLLWFAIFDLAGGAVNDIAQDATSYAHRDALFYLQAYVSELIGPLSKTSVDFLNGMTALVSTDDPAVDSNGAYAGYVDPALPNAQQAYWKANYPRLQQLKQQFDPTDMFHNPQSVRLP